MEAQVFSVEGKATGKVNLPETVFNVAWNPDLVHEVVIAMQSNARAGTAHTKDRSEVSGGGKKPWKQKGTGRARHGSRRSPIWRGGGITFGPRSEKDYTKKINKKMRAKALASTLSKKQADGEVLFVDALAFEAPKATTAKQILKALADGSKQAGLATKRTNAALIVLPERNEVTEKSFRNFGNLLVAQAKDINPVDLLTYKYVIMTAPDASVSILEKRVS
ncbi:MAG: 50S ribosomal protein L4 [Candidatus Paceibacterota bacterium]